MKLLVLGGTRFVGRHLVEAALAREHEVTLLNRGNHPEVFPEVEGLIGDRDGDLGALENRTWDAALDTSGYVPRLVRDSAERLRDAVEHYTFISTVSVYTDVPPHADEDARVRGLEDPLTEAVTGETYGGLKVLCEETVREIYGARSLIIRPGLVVGPYDPTDRFTYWPVRVAEGGEVLAPGVPEAPVQFIDARDLAAWTLGMIEGRETGTYNAVSPADRFSMGELLNTCQMVSGEGATFTWVDEAFLLEEGVDPFAFDLPLWLPESDNTFMRMSSDRAVEEGLSVRPLRDTVRDTLAWSRAQGDNAERRAGITRAREKELLRLWHEKP